MFCSKCGSLMNETDKFCTKCGATPAAQGAPQPPQPPQFNAPPAPAFGPPPPQGFVPPQYGPPQGYGVPPQGYGAPPQGYGYPPQAYMPKRGSNLWQRIRQMEGEKTVKTFICSRLKSLLLWNVDADGFLSVTNKRLIYWSEPRKPGERTVLQQEMPLKDVSGVSFYKGRMFSWLHFAGMILLNLFFGILLTTILSLIGGVAMKVIALIIAFGGLAGAGFLYYASKRFTHMAIPMLVNLSIFGFTAAAGVSAVLAVSEEFYGMGGGGGDAIAWTILAALSAIIYLFTLIMYAVRPTFALSIQSNSARKPIHLAGLRLFGIGTLASKAMSTEPAEESEALAGNLGAMIAELQENGDAAVEKWSK